ncbi:hypothetical protein E8E12_011625 [Didymella heteroderae]|uniref:Uncharacterized protein n=1 Tax=Didymella heteroderae TaxID=1769908 RepID=A0A9P4X0K2_9PLEO|nr:hypothetical protein E8E12_011625 [Didymella heteroderae]
MAQAERRVSLGELIRHAGITLVTTRQPCLPAPSQPSNLSSEEDRTQAREILIRRRQKNPESKDAVLKRIFKSSKEKEKALDTAQWEFSQDELDQALSAVIRNSESSPGLVQAFLSLGATVNFVDTSDKKKFKSNVPNSSLRRRSTVLQQAATLRKADSVNLLACSGADQTTLDEGLKAALTAKDQACIEELLRHGADLNRFPNALGAAIQSNDPDFVQLLLRAPKPLRPEVISSCLPAAVRQTPETIASLLISYGADPNCDSASALNSAIGKEDWKMTLTLVSGPTAIAPRNLQRLLDTVMRLRTCVATLQFLQLLFCCGLPPASIGLPDLLICRVRKNDTPGSKMMINHGVPTTANDAECLRLAIENENWILVDAILNTPIKGQHASAALEVLPLSTSRAERLRILQGLLRRGADPNLLGPWLGVAVKERDTVLVEFLLSSGAPVDAQTVSLAVIQADESTLSLLCNHASTSASISSALPLVFSPQGQRHSKTLLLLDVLLTKGIDSGPALQTLQAAVEGGPENLDIVQRLLAADSQLLGSALEQTIALEDPTKKKPLMDALLKLGIPKEALDKALTTETQYATRTKDLSTTTVLVRQGASTINDEKHTYVASGLVYSPLSYVEHILAPHRTDIKPQLIDLLRDKGCEPRFHSSTAEQPPGAVGIPPPILRLVDRQKEHLLALKHAEQAHEHTRTLEETTHRDILRRKREAQDADFAAQAAAQAHWQALEQQKHDFEIQRVQAAERMKRAEKVAWHNLMMEQERDTAVSRQKFEERKASGSAAHEARMVEVRKGELEHRVGLERRMLKEKEELYERNVARQEEITKRLDESAQLHARLKQERPAIEGSGQWGTVD